MHRTVRPVYLESAHRYTPNVNRKHFVAACLNHNASLCVCIDPFSLQVSRSLNVNINSSITNPLSTALISTFRHNLVLRLVTSQQSPTFSLHSSLTLTSSLSPSSRHDLVQISLIMTLNTRREYNWRQCVQLTHTQLTCLSFVCKGQRASRCQNTQPSHRFVRFYRSEASGSSNSGGFGTVVWWWTVRYIDWQPMSKSCSIHSLSPNAAHCCTVLLIFREMKRRIDPLFVEPFLCCFPLWTRRPTLTSDLCVLMQDGGSVLHHHQPVFQYRVGRRALHLREETLPVGYSCFSFRKVYIGFEFEFGNCTQSGSPHSCKSINC